MHLLVTTSQSLLLLDSESGSAVSLDGGRGLYYGMSSAGAKLYVAARNRPVSSDGERVDERGEILVFDRKLRACGSLLAPFPLRDLHEIAWHEGRLWATCSHDNMVAVYDGAVWEQWFPLGSGLDGPGGVNHFNSIRFEGGWIWILAHNRGDSELLAFSIETRALQKSIVLGRCAHNIWKEQGQTFTCSSLDGCLLGDQGFALEIGGFPRGAAFGENFRCIGISATAERTERDFTTGKLLIFDGNWIAQREIILQDEGLILDIKILPPEFRHNPIAASQPMQFPLFDHTHYTLHMHHTGSTMTDTFYRSYEDLHRGSRELIKSRLKVYLPFLDPVVEFIAPGQATRAIDLGCGRGEWLEILREAGFDAYGVDLDEAMLAACHKRGLQARCADALHALRELASESMALVSAFHVVEHIPFDDLRTLVREALRVLKPGGLLILETPNPENLVVGSSLFYQDPSHMRPLPPELLRFVVDFEGFKRKTIARLQESTAVRDDADLNLLSVLEGVSPDYAVIAQKSAGPELAAKFDSAFAVHHGVTLAALAYRYDVQQCKRMAASAAESTASLNASFNAQQANFHGWIGHAETCLTRANEGLSYLQSRDTYLEQRIDQLENRLVDAERRAKHFRMLLGATLNGGSWRFTELLRWLASIFKGSPKRPPGIADSQAPPAVGEFPVPVQPVAAPNIKPVIEPVASVPITESAEAGALPPRAEAIFRNLQLSAEQPREPS